MVQDRRPHCRQGLGLIQGLQSQSVRQAQGRVQLMGFHAQAGRCLEDAAPGAVAKPIIIQIFSTGFASRS